MQDPRESRGHAAQTVGAGAGGPARAGGWQMQLRCGVTLAKSLPTSLFEQPAACKQQAWTVAHNMHLERAAGGCGYTASNQRVPDAAGVLFQLEHVPQVCRLLVLHLDATCRMGDRVDLHRYRQRALMTAAVPLRLQSCSHLPATPPVLHERRRRAAAAGGSCSEQGLARGVRGDPAMGDRRTRHVGQPPGHGGRQGWPLPGTCEQSPPPQPRPAIET